ncbi:UPF0234 protein [Trichinella spiralis]|uniref:UPF0234 protein n=1 Tax=Trichinella spiralis TaxID=6334 RepID=A0ABR3KE06_TRISP
MSTGVEIQGTAVALSSPDKSPLYIVLQCLKNKCFVIKWNLRKATVLKESRWLSFCDEAVIYLTHQISQWEMKLQLDEFKHFSMACCR